VLHSDAGRRRGASDKVSKHPFYVDGPTFGNRIRVELLILLVCMCAGISRLHRPSRNAWLFRLAYRGRRFESPTYDPQIWENGERRAGMMEAGRLVRADKRGGNLRGRAWRRACGGL
jgi:hypothetical protein